MNSAKPPGSHPRGLRQDNAAAKQVVVAAIVDAGNVNRPVSARLWQLRARYGYFTRAEVEAALGIPSPRGEWACPGEFGADGRWQPHCECAA